MTLRSLGYLGVSANDLDTWKHFAEQRLGMQVVERGAHALSLRMDDQAQRIIIDRDDGNGLRYCGWAVDDAAALAAMAVRLEAAGVPVVAEPRALAERRGVAELISFQDPAGNRIELFHGPCLADTRFQPGRAISGFRTGPLGMGHLVLTVRDIASVLPFYRDVLGFRLSDYALKPFKAYFFHINSRHHSFALVETGTDGVHHVMVELMSLDDVGQGYDLAQLDPDGVSVTLGRHSNDLMTSFYMPSPGGFMFEYGWGGRSIDIERWKPFEYSFGPSLWGHERSWLPREQRAQARELRMAAAAAGIREAVRPPHGSFIPDGGPSDPLDDGVASHAVAQRFAEFYRGR